MARHLFIQDRIPPGQERHIRGKSPPATETVAASVPALPAESGVAISAESTMSPIIRRVIAAIIPVRGISVTKAAINTIPRRAAIDPVPLERTSIAISVGLAAKLPMTGKLHCPFTVNRLVNRRADR